MSAQVERYWMTSRVGWLLGASVALIAVSIYRNSLWVMVQWWDGSPEYSHGFLIPLITSYLIWQRTDRLREIYFDGSWAGIGLAVLGLALFVVGELATIYVLIQYAFVIFVLGAAWAWLGNAAFRFVAIPLGLLFFMVPFPAFIYNSLSSNLQLLSSQIGVAVIRLFDIPVHLEGNVIDLGTYKLQVVEACSGLRYLFPLMTLGVIVAYFYNAPIWKRLVIFASTIPITILMNSFRIGVIGVMVDRWGQSMAEGFLHDFEGWAIFMVCFGILFVEMWLLLRLTRDRRPLGVAFGIDPPVRPRAGIPFEVRPIPRQATVLAVLTTMALVPALLLPNRQELVPARQTFAGFPLKIGPWTGQPQQMEAVYLNALKLTDYALTNYADKTGDVVNFYSAYYASQRKGESVHSPKSCLPGGGWVMESLAVRQLDDIKVGGVPLRVNRSVISLGDQRELVYYWFQERGRVLTNEYLVKWYVFWDALTRNRTDGALVRLIITQKPGQDVAALDRLLTGFARDIAPLLPAYIPD